MKKSLGTMIILLALGVMSAIAVAPASAQGTAVPEMMNYQGYLTDNVGNPINATGLEMRFTIYEDDLGTMDVWREIQFVDVTDGLFTVILGSGSPMYAGTFDDESGDGRFLGVKVGTDDEMTPLQQLITVPYSFRADKANNADTLDGMDSSDFGDSHSLDAADGSPYNSVFVDNRGFVGMSTQTPAVHLDVNGMIKLGDGPYDFPGTLRWDSVGNDFEGRNNTGWVSLTASGTSGGGGGDSDWAIVGSDMYSGVSGNVGIGETNPSTKLDVDGEIHASGTITSGNSISINGNSYVFSSDNHLILVTGDKTFVDQSLETQTGLYNGSGQWQSFTAGMNGSLTQVDIKTNTAGDTATLTIYEGEGTGGTQLSTTTGITLTSFSWVNIPLTTQVEVTSGNVYTWYIQAASSQQLWQNDTDAYAGGQSWFSAGNDLLFRTHVWVEGNVGIGTANPGHTLDVAGKVGIDGTQILYLPDQGDCEGTLIVGDGGSSLDHISSVNGIGNTALGIGALNAITTGNSNTAIGRRALESNTTGYFNTASGFGALASNKGNSASTAVGYQAMYNADNRTTGRATYNTAVGYQALSGSINASNNTGQSNTAVGDRALKSNTTGDSNTAIGRRALESNTTGDYNTASGGDALASNTTGLFNTASGVDALYFNTTGDYNIASGYRALRLNTTGNENTAYGGFALWSNDGNSRSTAIGYESMCNADSRTTGRETYNTAVGYQALSGSINASNNTGRYNTAVGDRALTSNTIGDYNTASGVNALHFNTTGYANTAIGYYALYTNITGHSNTAIGHAANFNANNLHNATAIGAHAQVNASDKVVIGNDSVSTIGGYADWSNYSDRRLKENIEYRDDLGLNFITKLEPVTFNYKGDENKRIRDGLIAQDVEAALEELDMEFSGLIVDEDERSTLNLSYGSFTIPLINAVKEQQETIEELQAQNESLIERIEALEAE